MPPETGQPRNMLRNLEVLLGALATLAAAWALIQALPPAQLHVAGLLVPLPGMESALLSAALLVALQWLVSLARRDAAGSLASLLPLGAPVWAAGIVVMYLAVPSGGNEWLSLAPPAAAATVGFVFAWMAYRRPRPAAARVLVAAAYILCMGAIAIGANGAAASSGAEAQADPDAAPLMPFDGGGLLAGNGADVTLEKVAVSNDWRDAVRVSPGGLFAARVALGSEATLRFAVAASAPSNALAVDVTLVGEDGSRQVVFHEAGESLSTARWRDASVSLPAAGDASLVFEATGLPTDGAALFANPRIVTGPADKLRVVVVVCDALRADHLGAYGYSRDTTREIDERAARAVVFRNCFSQAPNTVGSMASILTSLYPTEHGMTLPLVALSPTLDTLAGHFADAGYLTGCIQTNPNLVGERGVAKGFHEYYWHRTLEPTPAKPDRYANADQVTDQAIEWLGAHKDEASFLYVHYMDVHSPYVPPKAFARFGPEPIDLYDGEIAYFSSAFARLYDFIAEDGGLDNTLLVLTADHGEQFREHGFLEHGNCLNVEELHVPLLLWLPGRASGAVVDGAVRSIDIAPTLLDLAGLRPLGQAGGASLRAAFEGGLPGEREVWSELEDFRIANQWQVALLRDGYRLIVYDPLDVRNRRIKLYNVADDAREYVNIADSGGDALKTMLADLDRYVVAKRLRHARLVPKTTTIRPSAARIRTLRAIGYLNGSADSGGVR